MYFYMYVVAFCVFLLQICQLTCVPVGEARRVLQAYTVIKLIILCTVYWYRYVLTVCSLFPVQSFIPYSTWLAFRKCKSFNFVYNCLYVKFTDVLIHVTVMVHNLRGWCLGDIHTVGVICILGLYKFREQDNLSK